MKQESQINAFSRPPVFTQIIAYCTVIAQLLIYIICMFPNFIDLSIRNGLAATFYSTFIIAVTFWFLTSITSASDHLIRSSKKIFDHNMPESTYLFCEKCKSSVKESSVHCNKCGVCVEALDHHCIWINHCIGRSNYTYFILMALFVNINFILFIVTLIMLWKQENYQNYLSSMIVSWTISSVLAVFSIMLTALLIFHVYLKIKNTTTFLYWKKDVAIKIDPKFIVKSQQKIDQKVKQDNKSNQKKQELFFELNKKMEISQSIHDLKISKSKSNVSFLQKGKRYDSHKQLN